MSEISGFKLQAVVASLVENLGQRGSWCGETHIQKATYFLSAMAGLPVNYEFILYKHGPYSFDLHADLVAMTANGFLTRISRDPWGSTFKAGDRWSAMRSTFSNTLARYSSWIAFVADNLSNMTVAELEKSATALYVTDSGGRGSSVQERAAMVNHLKPHISLDSAMTAISQLDEMLVRADCQRAVRE